MIAAARAAAVVTLELAQTAYHDLHHQLHHHDHHLQHQDHEMKRKENAARLSSRWELHRELKHCHRVMAQMLMVTVRLKKNHQRYQKMFYWRLRLIFWFKGRMTMMTPIMRVYRLTCWRPSLHLYRPLNISIDFPFVSIT